MMARPSFNTCPKPELPKSAASHAEVIIDSTVMILVHECVYFLT
jgi:hypothetical protein